MPASGIDAGSVGALRLFVMGGLNVDYHTTAATEPVDDGCALAEHFSVGLGGHAGNCAVTLARLGARVSIAGSVGDDPEGELLSADLESAGVDTRHLVRHKRQGTGRVFIPQIAGRRYMLMYRGANDSSAEELRVHDYRLDDYDAVVVLDPQADAAAAVLEGAARAGRRCVCWSPGGLDPARVLRAAEFPAVGTLVLNRVEFATAFGSPAGRAALRGLVDAGVEVVRTEGADGVTVLLRAGDVHLPAVPIRCVDATGAGDAFVAAWVVGFALGRPIGERLSFANTVAAMATRAHGARGSLPGLAEALGGLAASDQHPAQARP